MLELSTPAARTARRIRRRLWVSAGFVLVSILIGALAGAGGVLLFGGSALLLVALVAMRENDTAPSATDPSFPTCAAANRAGFGPYQRGVDTEYNWYRDRDGDGLVCER